MNLERPWRPAFAVALAFALALAIVDPFRDFLSQDDSWAYARMVEHLLQTGRYRLDAWAAANMPVQIGFAAALSTLFGYSFGILRTSTLALLAVACAALFGLARECGADRRTSTALALALLASPLVLLLGFTFMSDVQFTGWMLLALWLWARGWRAGNASLLFLGSLAAVAAIGTRQFGIALLAGPTLAAIGARRAGRSALRPWLVCVTGPAIAAALQIVAGLEAPNFTQAMRLGEQARFVDRPLDQWIAEFGWRIAVVCQYIGLLALPASPLAVGLAARRWRQLRAQGAAARRLRTGLLVLTLLAATFVAGALWLSATVSAREPGSRILPLPWMLENVFWPAPRLMLALALGGVLSALALLWAAVPLGTSRRDPWDATGLLLVGCGVALLALHLGYVQLNDTYLVAFVPFALLLLARVARRDGVLPAAARMTIATASGSLLLLSLWMRGDYAQQEAQWQAADRRLATGVALRCIGGSKHWAEYRGAFDEWLAEAHPGADWRTAAAATPPGATLHAPFYAWLRDRAARGSWLFLDHPGADVPEGWRVVDHVPYRDRLFRPRRLPVFARSEPWSGTDPACR